MACLTCLFFSLFTFFFSFYFIGPICISPSPMVHMGACVRMCARVWARMRACMRTCVCARVCVRACMCMCVCVLYARALQALNFSLYSRNIFCARCIHNVSLFLRYVDCFCCPCPSKERISILFYSLLIF